MTWCRLTLARKLGKCMIRFTRHAYYIRTLHQSLGCWVSVFRCWICTTTVFTASERELLGDVWGIFFCGESMRSLHGEEQKLSLPIFLGGSYRGIFCILSAIFLVVQSTPGQPEVQTLGGYWWEQFIRWWHVGSLATLLGVENWLSQNMPRGDGPFRIDPRSM